MTHQLIKTNLAIVASSIALTACISFSSETSAADSAPLEPQTHVNYGIPDWAKLTPGKVTCNEGKNYTIIQAEAGKHITINWLNKQYILYNIPTSTGTYRYEDKASGLVIVQIPEKSLLLNSKLGQRLADECRKR